MRYVLVGLLGAHSLVHLMGFAKAYRLAELSELKLFISRPWGAAWLAAALLLGGAAVLRALSLSQWWVVAAAGALLSQVLVVVFWQDAKAGTLPNLVLAVACVLAAGRWQRQRAVEHARASLGALSSDVPAADWRPEHSLPAPVRRWLQQSGALARPAPTAVHLTQSGRMRTAAAGRWMPFSAQQWFRLRRPGFVWSAQVDAAPGVHLAGLDSYLDGRGRMQISLLSLWPVVDASGSTIDQGALLRFTAEMVWLPWAARAAYLRWHAVDDGRARVEVSDGSAQAEAHFHFDTEGRVSRIEAMRYRKDSLEPWSVHVDETAERSGLWVPTRCHVRWGSENDAWTWLELDVESLHVE